MRKILLPVFIIAILFISILAITQYLSEQKINAAKINYYNQQLAQLLTSINYNNKPLESKIMITDKDYLAYLGQTKPTEIYLAKNNNIIQAVILNTTASDGYNGNIDLLIAVKIEHHSQQHQIINIKTINHQETPGLGDFIDEHKSNWLTQFQNKFLNPLWGIKKDNANNQFDSVTGATITSRAVTNAVAKSLLLIQEHPEILQ